MAQLSQIAVSVAYFLRKATLVLCNVLDEQQVNGLITFPTSLGLF